MRRSNLELRMRSTLEWVRLSWAFYLLPMSLQEQIKQLLEESTNELQ
jgi:hypothetical protein